MISRDLPNEAGGTRYGTHLHPWCIVCLLPNMQRTVVARCRRRTYAEEHLKVLNRLTLDHTYTIVFDPFHE